MCRRLTTVLPHSTAALTWEVGGHVHFDHGKEIPFFGEAALVRGALGSLLSNTRLDDPAVERNPLKNFRLHILFLIVASLAPNLAAQTPTISAVVNAATRGRGGTSSPPLFGLVSLVPAISPDGLNVALAPGVPFSIFGASLTDGNTAAAAAGSPMGAAVPPQLPAWLLPSAGPLPTQLAGARVLVDGRPASLFSASPTEIDAQMPVDILPASASGANLSIQVEVTTPAGKVTSANQFQVVVLPFSPGVFAVGPPPPSGISGARVFYTGSKLSYGWPGLVVKVSDSSLVCPVGRDDCTPNPATWGEQVIIYTTGLGAVDGVWTSGEGAQAPSRTLTTPAVKIGGIDAPVLFSGLVQGFAGLYQVIVVVPRGVGSSENVALSVTIGPPVVSRVDATTFPMTSNPTALAVVKPPRVAPTGGGPPGGIVTALAVDPRQPATVYAGTFGGGVFKSIDGGGTWSGVNTGLTDLEVQAVVIHPTNSAVLYAGTNGGGVFKSIDGGGSWTAVNAGLTTRMVKALGISPANPKVIYAGTVGAPGPLFKSTDGGQSWAPVSLSACDPGAPPLCFFGPFAFANVYSIAIDPSNPNTVYAGTVGGSPGLGVYVTTNGGENWRPSGDFVLGGSNRGKINALAVDPTKPGIVYAATDRGLLKTSDGGLTWTVVFGTSPPQSKSFLSLAIDPANPNTVYAGAISWGVYKSLDRGGSWQAVNSGILNAPQLAPGLGTSWEAVNSGVTNAVPLADIWSLAIDPSNSSTVYAGSGGAGPLKTTDGGQNWTLTRSGFTAVDAQSLAIHPANPGTIYAGTLAAGIFKSTNTGRNWVNSNSNLTGAYSLVLEPGHPDTVYATELCCGLVKTSDGGQSWERNWGFTAADPRALVIDPSNPSVLYAGDAGPNQFGLLKTIDGGKTWICQVSGCGSWVGGIVLSLAIDPLTSSTLYLGTDKAVFETNDGGQTLTLANSGLPTSPVLTLAIDPTNPAVLYAGTSRGVFKTANAGQSWTDLGLATQLIYTLVLDWSNPSTIYAGTDDGGVFKSADGGQHWASSGFPTTPVQALAIDPTNPLILYAATRGSGVLQSTDGGASWSAADSRLAVTESSPFSVTDRGSASFTSSGTSSQATFGYGRIQPSAGSTTPSGVAIFAYHPGNYLVSETGVPATGALSSGRIYAEVNSAFNTGLAIANPNNQTATINFFYTDSQGNDLGSGTTTLGPNAQIATFLDSATFKRFSGATFQGTLTFTSNIPVPAMAIRSFYNERRDFLMSTLPVIDLTAPPNSATIVVPHFADGGGAATQILLVNPTNNTLTGNVEFRNDDGALTNVPIVGQSSNAYVIAPRSSQKLATLGVAVATVSGSVRIIPANGGTAPTPLVLFSIKSGTTTVAEAGVPAASGLAFRMYAESSGMAFQPGNIQAGIALANNTSTQASVKFELANLDGSTTGLPAPVSVSLPAFGHSGKFLSDIFQNQPLPNPYKGVVRISTASPAGISVVGLRTHYNELSDFLITTTPVSNEAASPSSAELFFPQLADGQGLQTQFIIFSGLPGQASSGSLRLVDQSGQPLKLGLR